MTRCLQTDRQYIVKQYMFQIQLNYFPLFPFFRSHSPRTTKSLLKIVISKEILVFICLNLSNIVVIFLLILCKQTKVLIFRFILSFFLKNSFALHECHIDTEYMTDQSFAGNSWGCDGGGCGMGRGMQEQFYGCADIAILRSCDHFTGLEHHSIFPNIPNFFIGNIF